MSHPLEDVCLKCGLKREERMSYPDGCPMRFPAHGCPLYDPPVSEANKRITPLPVKIITEHNP